MLSPPLFWHAQMKYVLRQWHAMYLVDATERQMTIKGKTPLTGISHMRGLLPCAGTVLKQIDLLEEYFTLQKSH